jgi:hypothetical protein
MTEIESTNIACCAVKLATGNKSQFCHPDLRRGLSVPLVAG